MDKTIARCQSLTDTICSGSFTQSDVESLLIQVRELPHCGAHLKDVGDYVAHRIERDQGKSHSNISTFLESLISVAESFGSFKQTPFTWETILAQLLEVLKYNGITIDKNCLVKNQEKFVDFLLEVLDKTRFKFDNPKIKSCELVREGRVISFKFELQNLQPGSMDIGGSGLTMTAPLFVFTL